METIFNPSAVSGLVSRINLLSPEEKARWGKMDTWQMLKHCTLSEEMFLGKKKYNRLFIGRLFGKMALNGILKDASPMKLNQPTHPEFKIKGSGDFETQKKKWIALLNEYTSFSNHDFVHPFFGKMTREQIGQYVYKHTDHHLRQFKA